MSMSYKYYSVHSLLFIIITIITILSKNHCGAVPTEKLEMEKINEIGSEELTTNAEQEEQNGNRSVSFVDDDTKYVIDFVKANHLYSVNLTNNTGGTMIGENEVRKIGAVVETVVSLWSEDSTIPLTYWMASEHHQKDDCLVLFINPTMPGYASELTSCDVTHGSMYTLEA